MPISVRDGRQLCLFENPETTSQLDELLWCRSFDRQESSLQSLSLYSNRASSSMAQVLIDVYSSPGEIVLDPFCGSGVIPFEVALADRRAWASDLNPYAYTITQGKLQAPRSERAAIQQVIPLLEAIEQQVDRIDLEQIPAWVQAFFHPDTLRETVAAFQMLQQQQNQFLMTCLLGILHHVLPGCLSYPTNLQAPYLRRATYPPEQFPHLYGYRDVRSRLIAKIKRAYRRHRLPAIWEERRYRVWQGCSTKLPIADNAVDAIITSPPYPGALEYVRDHRLRLWFLGHQDWKALGASLIATPKLYLSQMEICLQEMARVLKRDRPCVLIIGDVEQHGKVRGTANYLADLAVNRIGRFTAETLYDIQPPQARRSHSLRATKFEQILVLRKTR